MSGICWDLFQEIESVSDASKIGIPCTKCRGKIEKKHLSSSTLNSIIHNSIENFVPVLLSRIPISVGHNVDVKDPFRNRLKMFQILHSKNILTSLCWFYDKVRNCDNVTKNYNCILVVVESEASIYGKIRNYEYSASTKMYNLIGNMIAFGLVSIKTVFDYLIAIRQY